MSDWQTNEQLGTGYVSSDEPASITPAPVPCTLRVILTGACSNATLPARSASTKTRQVPVLVACSTPFVQAKLPHCRNVESPFGRAMSVTYVFASKLPRHVSPAQTIPGTSASTAPVPVAGGSE